MTTPVNPALSTGYVSSSATPFGQGYYLDKSVDPSFTDRYLASVSRWFGRVWGGQTGDKMLSKLSQQGNIPEAPRIHTQNSGLKPLILSAKGSLGWGELLGINGSPLTEAEQKFATRNPVNYGRYVSSRLKAPRVTVAQAGGPGRVAQQLAVNNFKGLFTAMEQGKWLTAGSTLLGMGLFALGVGKETVEGYQRAKQDEAIRGVDGFSTMGKTGLSFVKALGKAGLSWEAGSIGMRIGSVLGGPFGALAGTLAGVAVGGIFSVGTKMALDEGDKRLFGDAKEDVYA